MFAAEHVGGDRLGLVDGVRHAFQPDAGSPPRKRGAVAGSPDRRVGGTAEFVDRDAVVDRQPGCLGKLRARRDADAGDDEINVETRAVRQLCGGDAILADEPGKTGALADVDAVGPMQVAEVVGGPGGGDALQDTLCGLDENHLQAGLCSNCGRLQPDVAAADDQHAPAGDELGRHRIDVGDGAHDKDAVEIAADRGGQAARARAGGERKLVVADDLAVDMHRPCGAVDGPGARRQPEVDALLGVEFRRAQEQPLDGHLAAQIRLRQRRALVGEDGFLADQHDRPVMAAGTQARDERGAGLACPDDDDSSHPHPQRPASAAAAARSAASVCAKSSSVSARLG